MGECGCGDGFGLWQFPGPEGTVYTFDVYYGCSGCSNATGIIVHSYKGEALVECCPTDVEPLPWHTPGPPSIDGTDWGYSCFAVPLVNPETLVRDIVEAVGDVDCEIDGESWKLSELLESELMYEVVGKNMERTFNEWIAMVREQRRKARKGPDDESSLRSRLSA